MKSPHCYAIWLHEQIMHTLRRMVTSHYSSRYVTEFYTKYDVISSNVRFIVLNCPGRQQHKTEHSDSIIIPRRRRMKCCAPGLNTGGKWQLLIQPPQSVAGLRVHCSTPGLRNRTPGPLYRCRPELAWERLYCSCRPSFAWQWRLLDSRGRTQALSGFVRLSICKRRRK